MVDLSEADLHFCSAHGANCGGQVAVRGDWRGGASRSSLGSPFPYQKRFRRGRSPPAVGVAHASRPSTIKAFLVLSTLATMAERKQWLATRGPVVGGVSRLRRLLSARQRRLPAPDGRSCRSTTASRSSATRTSIGAGSPRTPRGHLGRRGIFPHRLWAVWHRRDQHRPRPRWLAVSIPTVRSRRRAGARRVAWLRACARWMRALPGRHRRLPDSRQHGGVVGRGGWLGPGGVLVRGRPVETLCSWHRRAAPRRRGHRGACRGSPTAWRCGGSARTARCRAAFWYEGGRWQRYEWRRPQRRADGGIAALSRISNSMEVWWVGANGSVQAAAGTRAAAGNATSWRRPAAPRRRAASRRVSRISNSMEVWWVGANGSVQAAFWYEGGHGSATSWRRRAAPRRPAASRPCRAFPTAWRCGGSGRTARCRPRSGTRAAMARYEIGAGWSASPTAAITAVSRIPTSMELWWVGADGSVQGAFWYEGGHWQRYELAPAGSASPSEASRRCHGSRTAWRCGGSGPTARSATTSGIHEPEFDRPRHSVAVG